MTRDEASVDATRFMTRRQALRAVGVSGVAALAGCLHDDPCRLSVTKEHGGESVTHGDTTEFQITVCNEGEETCEAAVTVVDDLPSGVTHAGDSGNGWNCTDNGGTVSCVHDNANGLAGGDCLPTLTLTVAVGDPDQVGGEIANCATVNPDDTDVGGDTDCVTVPVESPNGECDLAVSKRLDGDVVTEGTTATFGIEVCNEGEGDCTEQVTVVDALPSGVAFDGGSGAGWSCTDSGGVVTCTHANGGGLGPGECLPTLELTVEIGPMSETGDRIRNCASLRGSDADASNDRDCVSVPVQPGDGECDLSVRKRHAGGDVAYTGETTTFDIVVCNVGDGDCPDPVTVVDDLQSGVSFVGSTGAGWTVTESGGTVTATHANAGGLAAGDCLPVVSLEVELGSLEAVGDQLRNCARLEPADGDATNDTGCVTVTVSEPVGGCNGLEIEKVAATQFTYGETESYDITVCNPTTQACDGAITVTDELPGGMSFVSVAGSGWTASESGGVVTATHPNNGTLAPGACLPTLTLTVQVVPASQFPGGSDGVQNCAQLLADGAIVDEACVYHVITNV